MTIMEIIYFMKVYHITVNFEGKYFTNEIVVTFHEEKFQEWLISLPYEAVNERVFRVEFFKNNRV